MVYGTKRRQNDPLRANPSSGTSQLRIKRTTYTLFGEACFDSSFTKTNNHFRTRTRTPSPRKNFRKKTAKTRPRTRPTRAVTLRTRQARHLFFYCTIVTALSSRMRLFASCRVYTAHTTHCATREFGRGASAWGWAPRCIERSSLGFRIRVGSSCSTQGSRASVAEIDRVIFAPRVVVHPVARLVGSVPAHAAGRPAARLLV